jgi:hypothetical protein
MNLKNRSFEVILLADMHTDGVRFDPRLLSLRRKQNGEDQMETTFGQGI